MNILNQMMRLIGQYNSRQQLRQLRQLCQLPEYLLEDIGKMPQDIAEELTNNSVGHFIVQVFCQFKRGA